MMLKTVVVLEYSQLPYTSVVCVFEKLMYCVMLASELQESSQPSENSRKTRHDDALLQVDS